MARKKGKSVSFDAMVKFFMNTYNIPTKQDIDRLNERLDRIERLILNTGLSKNRRGNPPGGADRKKVVTASDHVLEIVQRYKDGVSLAEIKLQTRYGEKKLRNIIFRLHKTGKIKRISRGIYVEV